MNDTVKETLTIALAITIYALWLVLTACHSSIPYPLLFLLGGLTICWHGSLQHEAIHGHPFKSSLLNSILVYAPLGLVIPYPIYKQLHTLHHQTERITDPFEDPESFYYSNCDWNKTNKLVKSILSFNNTLLGRLTVGPVVSCYLFLNQEVGLVICKDFSHVFHWLVHSVLVITIAFWVVTICGISPINYILFFVYPGIALTLMRSFAEHRPANKNQEKSAIIKSNACFQLLYLNNNFHYIHHKMPGLAWYKIPSFYTKNKDEVLSSNGGYYYPGYSSLVKEFLLRPKDSPVHPSYR